MNTFDSMPPSRSEVKDAVTESEITPETINSQLDSIDSMYEGIKEYAGQDYNEVNREKLETLLQNLEDAINTFETDFHDLKNGGKFEVDEDIAKKIEDEYLKAHRDWIAETKEGLKGLSMNEMLQDPEVPSEGIAEDLLEEDTEEVVMPAREEEKEEQAKPPMMMEGEKYGGESGADKPDESIAAK